MQILRRTAVIVVLVCLGIVFAEWTRPWREGLSLTVIEGVDRSYAGKYVEHAAYQQLLGDSARLRSQALGNVKRRVGLQPIRTDTLVVRYADGLKADAPIATRRTLYVGGRSCQVVTMFLEPILLGSIDVERTLTHELVHATMRQHMGHSYGRLPQWLREAIATWGAEQLEEKTSVLIAGKVYAIEDPMSLINGLEGSPHTVDAYLEEVLLFEYLAQEHGHEQIVHAVHSIVDGERYQDVFERLTGVAWEELQEGVRAFSVDYINEQLARAGFREYEVAIGEYRQGLLESASTRVRAFIRSHPESLLRANATYVSGELQFALERLEDATVSFRTVVDEFPTYFYVIDDAQYLLGVTYSRMGKPEQARAALETFLRDFTFANEPLRPAARALLRTLQGA